MEKIEEKKIESILVYINGGTDAGTWYTRNHAEYEG